MLKSLFMYLVIYLFSSFFTANKIRAKKYSFGNCQRFTLNFIPSFLSISINFLLLPIPADPLLFLSLSLTVVILFKQLSWSLVWLFSLSFYTSLQWSHRHPSCSSFSHTLYLAPSYYLRMFEVVSAFFCFGLGFFNPNSVDIFHFDRKITLCLFHIQIFVVLIQVNGYHQLELRS